MRAGSVGLVALTVAVSVTMTSVACARPMIHGDVLFGKWLEDEAPSGSIGLGGGVLHALEGMPLAIGVDVAYHLLGSFEITVAQQGVEDIVVETDVSTIPITAQFYYMTPAGQSASFYAGVGFGAYVWRVDAKATVQDVTREESRSDTDLGLNVGGGVKSGGAAGGFAFGADVKLHIILSEDASTQVLSVGGRIYF